MACFGFALAKGHYYPNSLGLSWTYDNGETQVITGKRNLNGQDVVVLTHYIEGSPISEDYLAYREDGVFSVGTVVGGQTLLYSPELTVYQGNKLQIGQTWQSTSAFAGFDITLIVEVLGFQGVRTKAGRFNALQLRQTTLTSNGAKTFLDAFFVPSVGVVRFVTEDGTMIDLIDKNF